MSNGAIFDPSGMSLVVNARPIRGRIGGEFLAFAWSAPQWFQMFSGVDGVGYFVLSENRAGIVTVRVQPNSDENDFLDATLNTIIVAKALVPIVVKRGRMVLAGYGVVQARPPFAFSDGSMQNEWGLACTQWVGTVGGQAAQILGA